MVIVTERKVLTLLRNTLYRHRMVFSGIGKIHIGMGKTTGPQRKDHPGGSRYDPRCVYRKTGGIHIHVGRVIRRYVHTRRPFLITETRQLHPVILDSPTKRDAREQRIDFYIRIVRNKLRKQLFLIRHLIFKALSLNLPANGRSY